MTDPQASQGGPSTPPRRRRADAERSRSAVLDAAIRLLAERPDAGMAAIAAAAGVTRQTVYAHFGTRDELLEAVADRITEEAMAAMDDAEVDEGPALEALLRLQDISWRLFEGHPVLLQLGAAPGNAEADGVRHEPVMARLTRLIEKGQAAGEFDPEPPAAWLVAAVTALGHAAGDEVGAGRMTVGEAAAHHRTATLRLLHARPHRAHAAS
ncbi:TetR/AcrR family transcriptional regulator [Streptomyces erythrochromogenes]|uniref:TetR/AcrR family transcriptional regulator n=1 Tax=Streptomyces erythrochromogenes TaxID=285574 RepID=UPI00225542C1|nr:TetR/AcrR family transcriptional regulator [Streptomyces erythrochromogenes]MCX5583081.1 TetR/AcrR family transcriptional regulator [Streptomyces erythrochromogenes]